MRNATLALLVLASSLLAACGSRQQPESTSLVVEDALPSLMGPAEETARLYIEDMTAVLEANRDDAGAAVERIEGFLRRNRDGMLENARALQQRYAGFEPRTRRVYEAQLAAYLQPAMERWTAVRQAFSGTNPAEGRQISDLIEDNDRD